MVVSEHQMHSVDHLSLDTPRLMHSLKPERIAPVNLRELHGYLFASFIDLTEPATLHWVHHWVIHEFDKQQMV
jgi:hypothetical protein